VLSLIITTNSLNDNNKTRFYNSFHELQNQNLIVLYHTGHSGADIVLRKQ